MKLPLPLKLTTPLNKKQTKRLRKQKPFFFKKGFCCTFPLFFAALFHFLCYTVTMLMRPFLYRILILIVVILCVGVIPSWAQKKALVQTKWNQSDGMRDGDDIYFLSSYSLYLPGKVIIPMFVVTDPRFLYRNLSLYRISDGSSDKLERLWSLGSDISGKVVNLQSCRYTHSGDKLYFGWGGGWDKGKKEIVHRILEYNLITSEARFFKDSRKLKEVSNDLDYRPPERLKQSIVWGRAGLQPLSEWELPSPLEYSSKNPRFLKNVIIKQKADRQFRSAALAELDSQRNSKILRTILAELEKSDDTAQRKIYSTKWNVLIRMSATLRGDTPPDIFSAAFNNDVEALREFLNAGADPNTSDDEGRTLLMYAVLGEAPDTMTLLFEAGADPQKKTNAGNFPWLYAALNPLRHHFLKLWGK